MDEQTHHGAEEKEEEAAIDHTKGRGQAVTTTATATPTPTAATTSHIIASTNTSTSTPPTAAAAAAAAAVAENTVTTSVTGTGADFTDTSQIKAPPPPQAEDEPTNAAAATAAKSTPTTRTTTLLLTQHSPTTTTTQQNTPSSSSWSSSQKKDTGTTSNTIPRTTAPDFQTTPAAAAAVITTKPNFFHEVAAATAEKAETETTTNTYKNNSNNNNNNNNNANKTHTAVAEQTHANAPATATATEANQNAAAAASSANSISQQRPPTTAAVANTSPTTQQQQQPPPTTTTTPIKLKSLSNRIQQWAAPPLPLVALVGCQHTHAQLLVCSRPQQLRFVSFSNAHRLPTPKRQANTTAPPMPTSSDMPSSGDPLLAPPRPAAASQTQTQKTPPPAAAAGVPGILKEYWLEKRTRLVPALCVFLIEWPMSQKWDTMAAKLTAHIAHMTGRAGPAAAAAKASALTHHDKRHGHGCLLNGRQQRTSLICLLLRPPNAPPLTQGDLPAKEHDVDQALTKLGRRCGLGGAAGSGHGQRLFVWQPNKSTEAIHTLNALHAVFYKGAILTYKAEFKRLRIAKRPDATKPSASDDIRRLSMRQNFKIGYYAELIGDGIQALKYFRTAYSLVSQMYVAMVSRARSGQHTTTATTDKTAFVTMTQLDASFEARAVACVLHRKIVRLLLSSAHIPEARAHFEQHVATYFAPSAVLVPPPLMFSEYGWLADEYTVFAYVLETQARQSAGDLRREVAYFMQTAAAHVLRYKQARRHAKEAEWSRAAAAAVTRAGQWEASSTVVTSSDVDLFTPPVFLGQLPWTRSSGPPKTVDVAAGAVLWREEGFDDSKRAIQLLTKAYEYFKRVGANRMILRVASLMATEYFDSGNFSMAKKFCDRIASTYRVEQWWGILLSILERALVCAQETGLYGDAVKYRLELLGKQMECGQERCEEIYRGLVNDVVKVGTGVEHDVSREGALVVVKCRFDSIEGCTVHVGQRFTLTIECSSNFPAGIELGHLDVIFSDADYSLRLVAAGRTSDPPLVSGLQKCYEMEIAAQAAAQSPLMGGSAGTPSPLKATASVPVNSLHLSPNVCYRFKVSMIAMKVTSRDCRLRTLSVHGAVTKISNRVQQSQDASFLTLPFPILLKCQCMALERGFNACSRGSTVATEEASLVVLPCKPTAYAEITQSAPCVTGELYPLLLTIHTSSDVMRNVEIVLTCADVDLDAQLQQQLHTDAGDHSSGASAGTVGAHVYLCGDIETIRSMRTVQEACNAMRHVAGTGILPVPFPLPDSPSRARPRLNLFFCAHSPGVRTVSLKMLYDNALGVRVTYESNFSVNVTMPFKCDMLALQRSASTTFLVSALQKQQSHSRNDSVFSVNESGLFFVDITNVTPHALVVETATLCLDGELFELPTGGNLPAVHTLGETLNPQDRYSDAFAVRSVKTGAKSPGRLVIRWKRFVEQQTEVGGGGVPGRASQTRIRGYTVTRQPSNFQLEHDRVSVGGNIGGIGTDDEGDDSGDEAKAWPIACALDDGHVAVLLDMPVQLEVPLDVLHVGRVRVSVRAEYPRDCVLGDVVTLCVHIVNGTNLVQDVTFSVISPPSGGKHKATRQQFALTGRTSGRLRLIPRQEQLLEYSLLALECGPMMLPRVLVKAARDGRFLNDVSDFGDVFVFPRDMAE